MIVMLNIVLMIIILILLWYYYDSICIIYSFICRAMQFLNDFQQIKIEDILPFFPNFVTIDHFKVLMLHTLL